MASENPPRFIGMKPEGGFMEQKENIRRYVCFIHKNRLAVDRVKKRSIPHWLGNLLAELDEMKKTHPEHYADVCNQCE